jgi:hypothetical protein
MTITSDEPLELFVGFSKWQQMSTEDKYFWWGQHNAAPQKTCHKLYTLQMNLDSSTLTYVTKEKNHQKKIDRMNKREWVNKYKIWLSLSSDSSLLPEARLWGGR